MNKFPNGPTPTQYDAWNNIFHKKNTLIVAPTGSGKTFAAFLSIINNLFHLDHVYPFIYCLYISPLKALGNDIEKNLVNPLNELKSVAEDLGIEIPDISVKVRSGDTLAKEREKIRRKPPQILITTPESAFLLLTSRKQRKNLLHLKFIIIDEIHALANNKRGIHLSVTLERLHKLVVEKTGVHFTRVALSATVNPIDEIQKFVTGISKQNNNLRPIELVKENLSKNIKIEIPLLLTKHYGESREGIWKKIYNQLIEIISINKPTLIFTNSRKLAEKVVFELNNRPTSLIIYAHHGSLSKEKRIDVENKLKNNEIDAVVSTSTLELGIDIGTIEKVVQLESPKSFSASMQRIGRSGHTLTGTAKGVFLSTNLAEYIECLVIGKDISKNKTEKIVILENNSDIIIQHLVSFAIEGGNLKDFYSILRSSYPFRNLEYKKLVKIAEFLSRRDLTNLPDTVYRWKPRLFFDPVTEYISDGSSIIWQNSGTIPETGQYEVLLVEENSETFRIGNLDEEFVFYLKNNDVIHLGGGISTYEVLSIDKGKILVKTSENKLPTLPYWKGPKLSRSYEVGRSIGEFKDKLTEKIKNDELNRFLITEYNLNTSESNFLSEYFKEQYNKYQFISGYKNLLVESFVDDESSFNIVITSPFGYSTNNTWLWTLIKTIEISYKDLINNCTIQGIVNDDMINIKIKSENEEKLDYSIFDTRKLIMGINKKNIATLLYSYIGSTKYFGTFFRINCVRSLLILRQLGPRKIPIKLQRYISEKILNGLINPESFLVYEETINEILYSKENLNVHQLYEIYQSIETNKIKLIFKESTTVNLELYSLYSQGSVVETPKTMMEHKARILKIPQYLIDSLQEREEQEPLFDYRIIEKMEQDWQHLSENTKISSARELQELFLELGDLNWEEIESISLKRRIDNDFYNTAIELIDSWLEKGMLLKISIGEMENQSISQRFIPVEYYADYEESYTKDVLSNPKDKEKIIEKYKYLLGDPFQAKTNIVKRFIQNKGPITVNELINRYQFGKNDLNVILQDLVALKMLVKGNFTGNKPHPQYLSYNNFKKIKEATNKYYLKNIESVSPEKYTQFILNKGFSKFKINEDPIEPIPKIFFEPNYPIILENFILSPRYDHYDRKILDGFLKSGEVRIGAPLGVMNVNELGKFNIYLKRYEKKYQKPYTLSEILTQYNSSQYEKTKNIYQIINKEKRIRFDQLILSTKYKKNEVALSLLLLFSHGFISLSNIIGLRTSKLMIPIPLQELTHKPLSKVGEYLEKINLDLGIGYWEPIISLDSNFLEEMRQNNVSWLVKLFINNFGVITTDHINYLIKNTLVSKEEFFESIKRLELENTIIKGSFVKYCRGLQYAAPEALIELRETEISEEFYFIVSDSSYNPWNMLWKIRDDKNTIYNINSSYFNVFAIFHGKIFAHLQFTKSLKSCEITILRITPFETCKLFIDEMIKYIGENLNNKLLKEFRISKWNKKLILNHTIHNYFEFLGFFIRKDYIYITQIEIKELPIPKLSSIPDSLKKELLSMSSIE